VNTTEENEGVVDEAETRQPRSNAMAIVREPELGERDIAVRIAVASGKGGTGKTTVATNLAWVAAEERTSVVFLDCDVEEPNGQIFLRPAVTRRERVTVPVPEVDPAVCDLCGQCGEICEFSAIVCVGEKVLVFPSLCHSCGGCNLVCAVSAITEVPRGVGTLITGGRGALRYLQGLLDIGEAVSPAVIRAVKTEAGEAELVIIDAPPGTACPAVEAIRGCDRVLLVTEPTPFGLHDLELAVETVRCLDIPCQVVINRAGLDGAATREYCRREGVEIVAELPDSRCIAEAYSRGELAAEVDPGFRDRFRALLASVESAR
jgi:MinD superfamily P-loop ATPase